MTITPVRLNSHTCRERPVELSVTRRSRHAVAIAHTRSEEFLPTLVIGVVFTFIFAIVLGAL